VACVRPPSSVMRSLRIAKGESQTALPVSRAAGARSSTMRAEPPSPATTASDDTETVQLLLERSRHVDPPDPDEKRELEVCLRCSAQKKGV
jgi:hypothetical protein